MTLGPCVHSLSRHQFGWSLQINAMPPLCVWRHCFSSKHLIARKQSGVDTTSQLHFCMERPMSICVNTTMNSIMQCPQCIPILHTSGCSFSLPFCVVDYVLESMFVTFNNDFHARKQNQVPRRFLIIIIISKLSSHFIHFSLCPRVRNCQSHSSFNVQYSFMS